MTDCDPTEITATGKNLTKDPHSLIVGGGDQRARIVVSWLWCREHGRPLAVCEGEGS